MDSENNQGQARILVVEDSEIIRKKLAHNLVRNGFHCTLCGDGLEALKILEKTAIELILSDQLMPGMDGLELLQEVRERYAHIPFILLTGHGHIAGAVAAIKQGAFDYLEKPYDPEILLTTIQRALSYFQMNNANKKLKDQLREQYNFQNIPTRAPAMKKALQLAEKVTHNPTTIAIYGASGTGKEVLARAIHFAGDRVENRFVAVNCAGIPSGLLESELFGHVKGAFTGADRPREGKFERAAGGTILLDEIGDMALEVQAKLLRVLEERVFEKLGSDQPIKADFRVIAATHKDLGRLVQEGLFREDLFHRINIFPITLPPLRERREDLPLLVNHFLNRFKEEFGKHLPGVSEQAMAVLHNYPWPGNIRELKNCLERAAILTEEEFIQPHHLSIAAAPNDHKNNNQSNHFAIALKAEDVSLENIVAQALELALTHCDHNKSRAADYLKIDRKMFYRRR
ncbi:MAG: sigma-54 dependent transcriptional regulator [Proteobacteria bacterium]|nr:sigma-54 dependent transcriptional regulator [Pseudomonadota bacterium]MBU1641378.1 sigma-54 dependent transcriptional regulator [Pseudomonadota bacterium]